ncbi:MAG: glgP [Parachlamydiales bacterium]|nr:glgP [Parachlamydiales bacterium]
MDLNEQAEALIQKIKRFIIMTSGRTVAEASLEEFYLAFCQTLREEIMVNWAASFATFDQKKPRILYYLSMEYLPGRLIGDNITNMGAWDLVKRVLLKMNRSYEDLMHCESDPGLGNGGLGRLASCLLDSLAAHDYPALAYGLRYQYGVFGQEIWNGQQVERPDCWLLNTYPWEVRRDEHAVNVCFRGRPKMAKNALGDDVSQLEDYEEVRALPFDVPIIGLSEKGNYAVLSLRLWSTKESPRNFQLQRFNEGFLDQASENTSLTDVLYPNDQTEMGRRVRLKQELLLVSASTKDIIRRHLHIFGNLNSFADKVRIQINDTHPALVIAELIRDLTKNFNYPWKDAVEITRTVCSYTNHTILKEALEEWSEKRLEELLPRQLQVIQKLNQDFCNDIRQRFPNDEERVRRMSIIEHGQVKMAHLAIFGSHKVNGVAKLHSEILKSKVFYEFYEMFPDRFVNVTNGVTQRRWLYHANPLLAAFITERIGHSWVSDFTQICKLADCASDKKSQQAFWDIKRRNKQTLIDFLSNENPVRDETGQIISQSSTLGPDALFDIHIKRFHEYKRQLLNAIHLIMLYQEIKEFKSNRVPRMAIFGGKAAAGYEKAKQIFRLICSMARTINHDPAMKGRLCIAMIENYNVSKAEIIIPAADLSEQISTAGWEASGTGNMKLSMNGALTIGTDDGANVEMRQAVTDRWWPFLFGATAEENANAHHYHSREIYSADPSIRRAIDALIDGTFAKDASEQAAFASLHASLLDHDRFFVLRDLRPFYDTQRKVEELYRDPLRWSETAIHNVAAMGRFSSDESIRNYAQTIWDIKPCPPDESSLASIRKEYGEFATGRITSKR